MRKIFLLAFLILAGALPLRAQGGFTTVSATVTDPSNNPYTNCFGEADFVPSPTATTFPTLSGSTFQTSVPISSCDSFGALTLSLADNAQVSDGHTGGTASQWRISICSSTTPKVCFSTILTITGATQNISAALKAAAAPLPVVTNPASLAGNNAFTGNNTHSGMETFSGPLVAPTIGPSVGQQHTLPAVASDTVALLLATQAFSAKTFDISLNTLKTATNTAGHVTRNNGTQYVDATLGVGDVSGAGAAGHVPRSTGSAYADAALGAADLSDGVTGTGAIVRATSPTLTSPTITSPVISGTMSFTQTFSWGCNGTATANTTLFIGSPGSATTTCTDTGPAASLNFTMPTAGTIRNLRVLVATAGVNASSGVFTLRKNNVDQAVTCTVGTGTTCTDTTNSFAIAAGDRLSVKYTTQVAETLANISVSCEKQ